MGRARAEHPRGSSGLAIGPAAVNAAAGARILSATLAIALALVGCRSAPAEPDPSTMAGSLKGGTDWSDAMFEQGIAAVQQALVEGRISEARVLAGELLAQHPPAAYEKQLTQLVEQARKSDQIEARRLAFKVHPASRELAFGDPLAMELSLANEGAAELTIPARDGSLWTALGLATADRSLVRVQVSETNFDGLGVEWTEVTSSDHELPDDVRLRPGERFAWQREVTLSARGRSLFRVVQVEATLRPVAVETDAGSAHYYPLRSARARACVLPGGPAAAPAASLAGVEGALRANRAADVFLSLVTCAVSERRAAMASALSAASQLSERSRRAVLAAMHYLTQRDLGLSLERWRSWWEAEGEKQAFWWERSDEGDA